MRYNKYYSLTEIELIKHLLHVFNIFLRKLHNVSSTTFLKHIIISISVLCIHISVVLYWGFFPMLDSLLPPPLLYLNYISSLLLQ